MDRDLVAGPPMLAPLAALVAAGRLARLCLAGYVRRRMLSQLERELMTLDDRLLQDIGIDRSEIGRAIRYAPQELVQRPSS
jgi:uncharacterized protein YjiS (DUF1127 family)